MMLALPVCALLLWPGAASAQPTASPASPTGRVGQIEKRLNEIPLDKTIVTA